MKRLLFVFAMIALIGLQSAMAQVTVNVYAKNYVRGHVAIAVKGKQHLFKVNEEKKASLSFDDITEPTWAMFSYFGSSIRLDLLLIPGTEVNIEFEADLKKENVGVANRIMHPLTLTCNDGGLNEQLWKYQLNYSKSREAPFSASAYDLSPAELPKLYDEVVAAEWAKMEKDVPEVYKAQVEAYIKFTTADSYLWFNFAKMRENKALITDDAYYQKIQSLIVSDDKSTSMRAYYEFVKEGTYTLAARNTPNTIERYSEAVRLATELESQKMKSWLVSTFARKGINSYGIDGSEYIQKAFKETITNPKAIQRFEKLLESFNSLAKGKASPTFNYPDVNGNMVSLESLKGKYVYIDMWATWCGPCKAEIPHLAKLEHDYEGRNIHFVSISTDTKNMVDRWKKMVKEKNMGGIQLNVNGDKEFTKAYKLQGIPRFILIDKEGKIVSAEAPRPSSEEIRPLFDSLEGL